MALAVTFFFLGAGQLGGTHVLDGVPYMVAGLSWLTFAGYTSWANRQGS